jgi:hypothetical protein
MSKQAGIEARFNEFPVCKRQRRVTLFRLFHRHRKILRLQPMR